ncbi:hypothetical protein [Pseudomonas sp. PSKL.D1]|uniref:hypothetical protein n=1 Tax=Pseudomonas sp. PSKL.D1 TaxID=3029060 RepID=UPI002380D21C|nr:hypothetical protein [Pseudomonas sp. PSKL.D1]WDY56108.1 hypothetical protein PVV54_16025 [Pseudomonas sp. PSKL.D1]
MSRFACFLLCCLASLAHAAEPEVRVQARLVPDTAIMAGATVNLEVDLLVDTWFTAPPELPVLQLPGAVVSPPGGEAQHLNQRLDGKAFFGLRFTYQITPSAAQAFSIPALTFRVFPGQATAAQTVQSTPLSFSVTGQAGAGGEQRLVAQAVEVTQALEHSHTPLRAGDSITRRLHIVARGGQAMLIPPPTFAEVKGLKRYVLTPSVTPLSDGRGGTLGGQREDSVTYVASAAGRYQLPAIEVQWWDAATGQSRSTSVPAIDIEAGKGTYQAPFSLSEDLRALGQGAQVSIASHGLLLVLLVLLGSLAWAGRAWGVAGWQWLLRWRASRHQAWLDSLGYAWRLARRQCAGEPARLDALYLWRRRATGQHTLSSSEYPQGGQSEGALLAFLQAFYAAGRAQPPSAEARRLVLQNLRQQAEAGRGEPVGKHALKPLNP